MQSGRKVNSTHVFLALILLHITTIAFVYHFWAVNKSVIVIVFLEILYTGPDRIRGFVRIVCWKKGRPLFKSFVLTLGIFVLLIRLVA